MLFNSIITLPLYPNLTDNELDYIIKNILEVANYCNENSIFYIVTGDVNEENKFSFPQLAEFLAQQHMYVSILTPGRPHHKFKILQKKYPNYVQVKSLSATNIISAMNHKNRI